MRNRLIRLKHRMGLHNWSEWIEFSTDHGMFLYRYCQVCRKVEWCKF